LPARSWATRAGTASNLLLGVGGTPEGVIAACAVKSVGGIILGSSRARRRERAKRWRPVMTWTGADH